MVGHMNACPNSVTQGYLVGLIQEVMVIPFYHLVMLTSTYRDFERKF